MDGQPPHDQRPFLELTWEDLKGRAKELVRFMPSFFRNPLEGIKRVPSWDWLTVIMLEILVTAVSSVLGGIVAHQFYLVFVGIIVGPVMGLLVTSVLSGLIYYACLFFMKTELEFRKIFIVVVLSKLCADVMLIFASWSRAPVTLICIIMTATFLIIGLSENFMLDRKKTSKIVGAIAGFALAMWLYSTFMDFTNNRIKVQDYTPESLDQIHKELNDGK